MSLSSPLVHNLVLDNGSGFSKCGISTDDSPKIICPSILGKIKKNSNIVGIGVNDIIIGDYAYSKRGILDLKYPIQYGIITDFDLMERFWHYIFHFELNVHTEECSILLTETSNNPNREKTAEIMFESFNFKFMHLANPSALSLLSLDKVSGLVLDCGDQLTSVVPIYNNQIQKDAILKLEMGGRDITEYLSKLMMEKLSHNHPCYRHVKDLGFVQELKEKCFISSLHTSNTSTLKGEEETRFELPDGKTIITIQDWKATEMIFNQFNIQQMIFESIEKTCQDNELITRRDMIENVVLSGGTTMFKGFSNRLMEEMEIISSLNIHNTHNNIENNIENKCKVVLSLVPNGQCSAWKGGSMLANLSTFQSMAMSEEEYQEFGPTRVHQKFDNYN